MLSVTPTAAEAVGALVAQTPSPDQAGVRIARAADGGDASGELQLSVVENPPETDQQVPDAPVYLDPEVAPALDDKTLDADFSGEQIRFSVRD